MESLDTNLTALFQWLLRATLQGSLLICLILTIKLALRERLPARWHYCLWLILLVRLSLPWAPQNRLSIYNLIPRSFPSHHEASAPADRARSDTVGAKSGTLGQKGTMGLALTGAQGEAPQRGQGGAAASVPPADALQQSDDAQVVGHRPLVESVTDIAPWLWLCGCLVLGGYILLRAFGLWWAVRSERPVTDQQILELLEDCKMQMRIRTLVGVVITDKVRTPALFGFLRPRILLPQGLVETLGLDELHYVFLHELAHLKRRDIYLAWLVCLLQILHWSNPLMWFAFRRMRVDQEMAADALALSAAGTEESHRYGQTIVGLIEQFSRPQYLPSLAGILENPSHVERRIQAIATFPRTQCRLLPAVVLLVFLGLITLTNAQSRSGLRPEEKVGFAANTEALIAPQANEAGATERVSLAAGKDAFVDPKTGIRFRKLKTISGPNDVISNPWWLRLSPNGRSLLDGLSFQVAPLYGGGPYTLVDFPDACHACWSPDGKKIAFNRTAPGSIWVVCVDPDTGQPTDPPKMLVECENQLWVRWLADSERIMFNRSDKEVRGGVWVVSIDDGTLTQVTDFSNVGVPSPDGESIAYSEDPIGRSKAMWVKDVKGGLPRKIADHGDPWCWSADGRWVRCYLEDRFVRIADGYEVEIQAPVEVGGSVLSFDAAKEYYYCTSYHEGFLLRAVSILGGATCQLGGGMDLRVMEPGLWPDSRALITAGARNGAEENLWALPLMYGDPIPLKMDFSVAGDRFLKLFSPGCNSLLYTTERGDGLLDVWVVPISWQEMRATGPTVLVFSAWRGENLDGRPEHAAWSSDGQRIALAQQGDIWVVSASDGESLRATNGAEPVDWLDWSPDGRMIAFHQQNGKVVRAVSSSGGEVTTICSLASGTRPGGWSPDGQAMILVSAQAVLSVSIADGYTRSLVNLRDLGHDLVVWLGFSPDGKILAFHSRSGLQEGQLFLLHTESGKLDKIATGIWGRCHWSPNGKWISYYSYASVKVHPEGVLWQMDVEEALAKLAK